MNLPTSGGASSTITISGATNSTLGSNGQQLCQICIDMNHDAVQELDVTLFAPDGSSVELILDTGLAINDDITFQICWVSCDQTANPDAGFPAVFDSDAGWQVGETYTGSYYPANGCLEDLTGDVNGDWELDFFDNVGGDGGSLFDWYLVFADDTGAGCANSGSCGSGPTCEAEGGELNAPAIIACEGDSELAIDEDPSFPNGNEPPAADYDYTYVIYDAVTGVIIDINPTTDLTTYPPGEYVICGLSYLISDGGLIPTPDGSLELDDIQDDIDDELYCADISDECISVTIEEPVIAPDFQGPLDVCAGELVIYEILDYDPDITYLISIQSGGFDLFTGSDGVYEVIWNSGPGLICAIIESSCGDEETCLDINVNSGGPDLEINGNFNPCPGDIETYTFMPSPGAGESYVVNVTNGTIINQTADGAEIEWINTPATGEICIELIGGSCPPDPLCEEVEIELDYELPDDFEMPDEICFGTTETASAETDPDIIDYIWTATNINIIDGFNTSEIEFEGVSIGVGTICLEIQTGCGFQGPVCQDIDILEQPDPIIDPVTPQCAYTFTLTATVLGNSELEWDQVSGPSDAIINPIDGVPASVEVFEAGFYTFELTESNESCIASDEITVEILPDLELTDPQFNCDQNEMYTVTFDITSGVGPYTVNGDNIGGNTFTSDPIESNEDFEFLVIDALGCQVEIDGDFECPCLSDAGTMEQNILSACAEPGAFIEAIWEENATLDGNDIGIYVLHDDDSDELGNIISISDDGIFFFDEDDLEAGQIYYVSYVVGDELNGDVDFDDDCLSVAIGQPIIFYPFPTATYLIDNSNCNVIYSIFFEYDVNDVNLEMNQIDGPTLSDVNIINDEEVEITFEENGTYIFESIYDVEGCSTTELIEITFNSAPSLINIQENCDNTGDSYTVSFEIIGGTGPFDVNLDGDLNGNLFISDPIPTGDIYTIQITDDNGCFSTEFTGQKLCDCLSSAGTMSAQLIEACGALDSIKVDTALNIVFDADDTGAFYLHRGNNIILESIIDSSLTGTFIYNPAIQLDTIYYISYVVGDSIFSFPDPSDPCFDVAVGQPVIWRSIPEPFAGDDIITCEQSYDLNATPEEGQWTIISSPGAVTVDISDRFNGSTTISTIQDGEYVLAWTVNNSICEASDTIVITKAGDPVLNPAITSCSDDLSTFTLQIPFENQNEELTQNGNAFIGLFEAQDLEPDSIYVFEFVNIFGCTTTIEVGPVNCDCTNDIGTFTLTDQSLCSFELFEFNVTNGDFILAEGDTLAYILHEGTADLIGNILTISYGEPISFDDSWNLNTTYYLTPVLTEYNLNDGTLNFGDPCFQQGPSSSVEWTESFEFNLDIDTLVCQGSLISIRPSFNGEYPIEIELTNQDNGLVVTNTLNNDFESFVLEANVNSNWTITNVSSSCIETFGGSISIRTFAEEIPEFEEVIICNNNEYGSIVTLDDILTDNSIQGAWDTGQIPLNNGQIDFDGFAPGDYTIEFSTEGFQDPCSGNIYSIDITVEECNCPTFDLSQIGFCELTNEIDLTQFNLFGLEGTWQLINQSGTVEAISIDNQILTILENPIGDLNLVYTIDDASYPAVCDPIVPITVFIEESYSSGTAISSQNYCEDTNDILDLDLLLEGNDPGGEWHFNNNIVNPDLALSDLSIGINTFEYRHEAGLYCPETSTTVSVEIFENPSFEYVSTDVLCFGAADGTIELILEGPDEDYVCYLDEIELEGSKLIEDLSPGTYELYIQDSNGCLSEVQTIVISEPQPVSVNLGSDQQLNFQDPFTVEAIINILISDVGEITWSDLNGILGVEDLSYSSIATADNTIAVEIEDINGCIAIDEINIRVQEIQSEIYIPNIFSPFSQDRNSAFTIQNTESVELIKGAYIYDRWGNLVYSQENVIPDNEFEVWDGNFGEQPAIQGVYVYVIELSYQNGRNDILVGDITLVR